MLKKIVLVIFGSISFILFISHEVYASFGISPAEISFSYLSPGMEFERTFLLSRTDSDNDVRVVVEADVEGINDWIRFEPGVSFVFPKGQTTKEMKVIVKVPENVLYKKNYNGYIIVKFIDDSNISDVSVVGGVGIKVGLSTTDEEVSELLVRNMRIDDTPLSDPIKLILTIENRGNREDSVDEVAIKVFDESYREVIFQEKDNSLDKISPGKTQEVYVFFINNLAKGSYTADVSVIHKDSVIAENTLVFSIIDNPFSDRDKGIYISLGVNGVLLFLIILSLVCVLIIVLRKMIKDKYFVE